MKNLPKYLAAVAVLMAPEGAAFAQTMSAPTQASPVVVPWGLSPLPQALTPETVNPEQLSVLQRARPDYDALGIPLGSFQVFSNVDLSEAYNSNVYVTPSAVKGDFYTDVAPGIAINSNWNRNALNFLASGEIRRYNNQVSQNENNFVAATNGRLDVERDVYFTGNLGYQVGHEDRTSPDSTVNEKNPIQYQVASANVGFVHDSGRIGAQVNGEIDDYYYGNGTTSTGIAIPETYRNRFEYTLTPRVSYEIVPGYKAFIQTPVNLRTYDTKFDPSGFQEGSHGYEIDVGTGFAIGPVLNGEAFIGYREQDFDDARFRHASGLNFGGNLLWNVTQETSIRAAVANTVEDTIVIPASSYVQSVVSLSVEHELRRNVLLTAGTNFIDDDFQGISRNDKTYQAVLGGSYLLNRYLNLGLTATYSTRDTNAPNLNYDDVIVQAKVRLQY